MFFILNGQDIVMASSPPVVGCLVKKGLQKGGSRAPQDPPGYALAYTDHKNIQRVSESTGDKFSCVTVSQTAHVYPALDTGYSLQVYPYGSL